MSVTTQSRDPFSLPERVAEHLVKHPLPLQIQADVVFVGHANPAMHLQSLLYRQPGCLSHLRLRDRHHQRSEEHTSELQSLMRISYAVFCLKKKKKQTTTKNNKNIQKL